MHIKVLRLSFEARSRLFMSLAALSVASLFVYVYAVIATVHNTATRQALQTQVHALTVELSDTEFKVLALKNKINLDLAAERGFKEVTAPIYVARTAGPSLTLR